MGRAFDFWRCCCSGICGGGICCSGITLEGDVTGLRAETHVTVVQKAARAPLSGQEQKILEVLRALEYGEVRIIVRDGAPVHLEEIRKSIKL